MLINSCSFYANFFTSVTALFDLNKIESNIFVQLHLILNILQVLKLEIYGSIVSIRKKKTC